MKRMESPYYPPRAAWYSAVLRVIPAARRVFRLEQFHLPDGLPLRAVLLSLLLPGYAFAARGHRLIARIIMGCYALLAIIFIVGLGYWLATFCFGLMLSLHVSSIIFLLNPWLAAARFSLRIATGLLVLLVVGGAFYTPIREHLESRWLLPLRVNDHIVIVQTLTAPQSLKPGDWVAYTIATHRNPSVYLQSGLGLQPILAVAGDHIKFTPETVEVNGRPAPRLAHMPTSGELVVPEKNWFIWPELAISNRGYALELAISTTMMQLALVNETQFIGKPFKYWFGRRQKFS